MITSDSLLTAIDRKRVALAAELGEPSPLSYSRVAQELGFHSSVFSRLKDGKFPNSQNFAALVEWVGGEELAQCDSCSEPSADPEVLTEADLDEGLVEPVEIEGVAGIFGFGRFSESEDPEAMAAIARARELISEGAVGVSVALDGHPDDIKTVEEAWKRAEENAKDGEMPDIEAELPEGFVLRQRLRHTAIVDTPAFDKARLHIREDGTLEGFITFEGQYTGDGRITQAIDLEAAHLPHPIIFDKGEGDHSGMTIGYIERVERRGDVGEVNARPILDDEAITASLKPMTFPAAYFAQTVPTGPEPLRISQPDARGYRSIRGLAAPKGVCHRSSMSCWTWPGDMDPKHRHFHTGTLIGLDDGSDIRVGALTLGGAHLNPALAQQGVVASQVGNHRDDANRVFALVRVWETKYGLMCAGVVPPDVSEGDVARALACSPSIEFWPEKGKRTLVGLHLVPTPALPVLASVGEAEFVVTDETIELEEPIEEEPVEDEIPEPLSARVDAIAEKLDALHDEMHKLMEVAKASQMAAEATLALTPIDGIDIS